jgi:hypothetical protein
MNYTYPSDKYVFIKDLVSAAVSFYGPLLTLSARSTTVSTEAAALAVLLLALSVEAPVFSALANDLYYQFAQECFSHLPNFSLREPGFAATVFLRKVSFSDPGAGGGACST